MMGFRSHATDTALSLNEFDAFLTVFWVTLYFMGGGGYTLHIHETSHNTFMSVAVSFMTTFTTHYSTTFIRGFEYEGCCG